jgi:hypothetical protein
MCGGGGRGECRRIFRRVAGKGQEAESAYMDGMLMRIIILLDEVTKG